MAHCNRPKILYREYIFPILGPICFFGSLVTLKHGDQTCSSVFEMIPSVLLVEDAGSVAKLKSGSSSCSELTMTVVSSLDEVALISSDDVRDEPSPSEFEAESDSKNIFVLPFRFDKCNNSLKHAFKS